MSMGLNLLETRGHIETEIECVFSMAVKSLNPLETRGLPARFVNY